MKKTVVIGASPNPGRYAYKAAFDLNDHGHEFIPVGIKKGVLHGKQILDIRTSPAVTDVDTVTMYIGPQHQPPYYDYILSLQPKRIIFNPGTENPEFEKLAQAKGIETEEACTLVLLSIGSY